MGAGVADRMVLEPEAEHIEVEEEGVEHTEVVKEAAVCLKALEEVVGLR